MYAMKKTAYWIIDYYYLLYGIYLMLTHKNPPKAYLDFVVKGKSPIILIPGISNKWGFLKHLGDSISQKGHPVYVASGLKFNFLDIPTSAKIVRKIIDGNNLKEVVIVGHSKGGLIGKYLLIRENKDNKIKKVIAIGAPFSGSWLAKTSFRSSFKELMPESKILQELSSNTKVNSKITSIMPAFDNHVWHEKGSFLLGATNITVPTKGHHKIVFDKDVIRKIIEFL